MKNSLLFFVLVLTACSSKTITHTAPDISDRTLLEFHWFFELYQTSVDSIGNKTVTRYDELNLVEVNENFVSTYIVKGDTVFVGSYKESSYQTELYKQEYLVISMTKGRSGAAVPDHFPRDSTLFISLETGTLKTATLPKIYFTRSQKFLNMAFNPVTGNSPGEFFAIVSIDFENNQLTLVSRNGLTYKHPLKSYQGIFRFGL